MLTHLYLHTKDKRTTGEEEEGMKKETEEIPLGARRRQSYVKITYGNLFRVILIYPPRLHFGVVYRQVPAVPLAQLEASAAHHCLLLWGHGFQGCQDWAAAVSRPLLVHAQVQGAILIYLHVWVLLKERCLIQRA